MKKRYIRPHSIAWYFLRYWKPITLLAVIGLIFAGLSAATLAFALEPEEPEEPVPVVQVEAEEVPPYFELTAEERRTAECIVMGEAGGESYEGKMLVAQCIINACKKDGIQPSEVRTRYKYSGWNENPSREAIEAVRAVFDRGETITDEPILYFYAPGLCDSTWHETQRFVVQEGGHRFFAEK